MFQHNTLFFVDNVFLFISHYLFRCSPAFITTNQPPARPIAARVRTKNITQKIIMWSIFNVICSQSEQMGQLTGKIRIDWFMKPPHDLWQWCAMCSFFLQVLERKPGVCRYNHAHVHTFDSGKSRLAYKMHCEKLLWKTQFMTEAHTFIKCSCAVIVIRIMQFSNFAIRVTRLVVLNLFVQLAGLYINF